MGRFTEKNPCPVQHKSLHPLCGELQVGAREGNGQSRVGDPRVRCPAHSAQLRLDPLASTLAHQMALGKPLHLFFLGFSFSFSIC